MLANQPSSTELYWETITSIDEVEADSNDKFYVLGYLETNPNDGEASGYWTSGILVECYSD